MKSSSSTTTVTWPRLLSGAILGLWLFALGGCDILGLGPFRPPEIPPSDEKHWLLKDMFLTAGSAAYARSDFDHTMQEAVNVVFVPANEKNEYTVETRWYDPRGQEYRTIRKHYDVKAEGREGAERKKGGTPRVHTMPTKELVDHKPGTWKVALYLDKELARRLEFAVR